MPDIVITSPAGVPEGLQSTASLAGGSSARFPQGFSCCQRCDDRRSTAHIWRKHPSRMFKKESTSINVVRTPGQSHSTPKDTLLTFLSLMVAGFVIRCHRSIPPWAFSKTLEGPALQGSLPWIGLKALLFSWLSLSCWFTERLVK